MLKLSYIGAELRRRRGRTILTALGLGLGVALVILVSSVSRGLDEAQSEVLEPLTGVGTEMSVSRPLALDEATGEGGVPSVDDLSKKEQKQIERELGGGMVDLQNLGDAGESFSTDSFASTEISFNDSKLKSIKQIDGVEAAAGGLTLNLTNISGKVPKEASTSGSEGGFGAPPSGGVPGGGTPDSIELEQRTVSGVDTESPDLGLLTSGQVTKGSYFGNGNGQAIVSNSYANEEGIEIGDKVKISDHTFEVVGLGEAAVGGTASDIYVELGQLQKLSDRENRVNNIQVNATSSDDVGAVANRIESAFSGSEVTTNSELAGEVSGSLTSTKDLTGKLGTALSIVALVGAFGIAALLTLSSVNKRTRELGTLKAIGWRQGAVVRQIAGESMAQGLLGGLAGAALGIGGAAIVSALNIGLDATLASQNGGGGFPPGGPGGAEPSDAIATTIGLDASVSLTIVLLAIGLAVIGGLVAGAIGGLRTARLRPAEALRSIE